MDLDAVRTFAAVADCGQFQLAADTLAVTQQAVSKRIAALEKDLGVRLFTRTPRGAELTLDGQAFAPHARELLRAEQRASDSVRPGRRALRVDVISRRIAPGALIRDFHRAHPGIELDMVTIAGGGADVAIAAIEAGEIDASFRAVTTPGHGPLPPGIEVLPAIDEPHLLLTGPGHQLAGATSVTLAGLAGHRIWMPGLLPGTEWAAYYESLAAEFGLTIDPVGPNFGTEHQLDVLAESGEVATLIGEYIRLLWPAPYDLRRIPVRDPAPVYPHALLWQAGNPHPGLAALRDYIHAREPGPRRPGTWVPPWAAGQSSAVRTLRGCAPST
ncbi:MAG TPA: LysR family transcriptional regulator [Streptosporangiaceae bacterium]